jgi:hypothetical protein
MAGYQAGSVRINFKRSSVENVQNAFFSFWVSQGVAPEPTRFLQKTRQNA